MTDTLARSIVVRGRVQGVGFRPFVSRIAHELGIRGGVRNRGGEVEIHAEGSADALTAFQRALTERAPPLAAPELPCAEDIAPVGLTGFLIEQSTPSSPENVHIPPDHFVCDDCLAEMQDPTERRYRYPFINCTQCGPRYTLIDRLPYDRPNTAMASFEMCPDCRREYQDPEDRRYHAQPLACPACGPRLRFRAPGMPDIADNEPALSACLAALRSGSIVAGVGGYHLLCDASNESVVQRLRERKHRPAKPLAVLVPWRGADGLGAVVELAEPAPDESRLLVSPLRPIVLVRKKHSSRLALAIAPGLAEVGVMLPYSPLHHLLADDYGAPLVATSGNVSGEPVLTDPAEVERRLGEVADAFLHHDRPIRRPADDAVYRRIAGRLRPLRLGRGNAPLERRLPFHLSEPLLALGAELKNTVALGFDDRVVISPHIGDLGSPRSEQVFERVIGDLLSLYGCSAERIVCDAHPDYRSARWARSRTAAPTRVYHHHAHASALAGEFGLFDQMLVFTWDGVGLGEDGTLWGGEALLGQPGNWRRVGTLRPFRLPGGERASRAPWRCALSLCWEQGITGLDCPSESDLLREAWVRGLNSPYTSSAGRLFDAAAALIGIAANTSYEAQAAMQLENLAMPTLKHWSLPVQPGTNGIWTIDWGPILTPLMDTRIQQADRASLFHSTLAASIATLAERVREEHGIRRVGLTGGVFQNRLLAEQAVARLQALDFEVFMPVEIPCNDAGIAYGQVIETGARQAAESPA